MPLITDPDFLSQGAATAVATITFSGTTGSTTTLNFTGIQNIIAVGDYFEIRGASTPENNGLYYTSTTGTDTATVIKVAGDGGPNPQDDATPSGNERILHDSGEAVVGDEKSVYIDFYNREMWLLKQGQLSNDGATLQAIYSFMKEEWKNDNALIAHPFPFTAITPEQFELTDNWVYHTGIDEAGVGAGDTVQDVQTRKLVRTGGWRELSANDVLDQEWTSIITLGTFEDNENDTAYYQQGNDPTDPNAAVDFRFAGPVNEAIRSYYYVTTEPANGFSISTNVITRTSGDWVAEGYRVGGQITIVTSDTPANVGTFLITDITTTALTVQSGLTDDADDTTFTSAVNNRNALTIFLRVRDADPNGKTYAQSNLGDIGVSAVDNKVFRFPVTNSTDLNIEATDATISSTSPYTEIDIRYFDQAYSRDVDIDGTPRDFGIVIDVGTLSGVDGSVTSGGSTLSSTEGGIPTDGTYDGGTLTIQEGPASGTYTIGTITTATSVPITGTFPASDTNVSFTLQRATPVLATAEEIYEKVQYFLRQAADIDSTDQVVIGNTADALLRFVGDTLEAGQAIPSNPNGGGSGVIIEGFSSNDTNRLVFFDNAGVDRTFPFVAAGTINFNNNLQNDPDATFWMFYQYTVRTTPTNAVTATASNRSVTFTTTSGTTNLPVVVANQYVNVSGFDAQFNLNGIYRVTSVTDQTTGGFTAYKVSIPDGLPETATGTAGAVSFGENPIDSPDAIIVEDNSGTPITGPVSGAAAFAFDYDYDNNSQGEREIGQGNAAIVIRAIGFDTAQFVETTGTITRNTGLSFTLVSTLERNYLNE